MHDETKCIKQKKKIVLDKKSKAIFLSNRKNLKFFLFNKAKFPLAVHIREAKCTCGEAIFLIL